jgi:hypothetical protein
MDIVTGCRLGFDSQQKQLLFSLLHRGPPNLLLNVNWELMYRVEECQRRKAHSSLSSSAEVKNAWTYTATSPYISMAWCLITRTALL